MDQWKNDFLNFENDLANTRRKLNDLIYEYQSKGQDAPNDPIYQDKLRYLEVELQYISNQLKMLKEVQQENKPVNVQMPNVSASPVNAQRPVMTQQALQPQRQQNPNPIPAMPNPGAGRVNSAPNPNKDYRMHFEEENQGPKIPPKHRPVKAPARAPRTTQDYEKLFGKNLMGIFASVLIFISLIIFATLILPHLTDTMKMIAMYLASAAVLTAGLLLYRKNRENLFYIAIIGCGAGSLYLSLLLTNLYFEVIGDIALYLLILVWAGFVRYLTKIKNLVFTIIGQAGILIATLLGTMMCVFEHDAQKYLVLTIFYFISAVVFSNIGKKATYEENLCTHICKTLNVIVYTIGLTALSHALYTRVFAHDWDTNPYNAVLLVINAFLFIGYLLLEFFFSYREETKTGIVFQVISMINTTLIVLLFDAPGLLESKWTFGVFMYLVAIAALVYAEARKAGYTIFSQTWCLVMIWIACLTNPFMEDHLFAYLTVIPCMLVGYRKKDSVYLLAGLVYLGTLPFVSSSLPYNYLGIEYLFMLAALYAVFLYVCRKTDQTWFSIIGYILLSFTTLVVVDEVSYKIMNSFKGHRLSSDYAQVKGLQNISTKSKLITFSALAAIHLVLNKLKYFGTKKPVEIMMYCINGLLMFTGCLFMNLTNLTDEALWKLPIILITLLLFVINSKEILPKHKYAGYYIAFKYTALMLCILGSYDVVDYMTSIFLLVFAIISIVTGFYKDMIAFRMYGLILSMISIVKLIMVDIKYDSTIENAISFFVSGVLCFVISFIYNRIDGKLRGK
ncbi:MAG: DUF2339 domain-containing protein [Lachnospiraceae bacterium]|nr:DUF2339 domain-containing protein [Lachnospiraceae bacterium]